MTQSPGVTATPPDIDWQKAPYVTAALWIALTLTILGGFGLIIGLSSSVFAATTLVISGAVLLGTAGVCWCLYALALFWRHESRNQMLTVCAAIVRDERT